MKTAGQHAAEGITIQMHMLASKADCQRRSWMPFGFGRTIQDGISEGISEIFGHEGMLAL